MRCFLPFMAFLYRSLWSLLETKEKFLKGNETNLKHFEETAIETCMYVCVHARKHACTCARVCGTLADTVCNLDERTSESGLSVISVTLSVRLHLTNERCWQLAPSSPGSAEWDGFVSRPLSGPYSLCSSPSVFLSLPIFSHSPSVRESNGHWLAPRTPPGIQHSDKLTMGDKVSPNCIRDEEVLNAAFPPSPPPKEVRKLQILSEWERQNSRGNVTMSEMAEKWERKVGRVNISAEWV